MRVMFKEPGKMPKEREIDGSLGGIHRDAFAAVP